MDQARFYQQNLEGLHLILGPMFSGKTTKLLEYVHQAQENVISFKPAIDIRYDQGMICSHDGLKREAVVVSSGHELYKKAKNQQMIAIDEVQFFDDSIIEIVEKLIHEKRTIVVSGLDKDYLHNPFSVVEQLKERATKIIQLEALCALCGDQATHTYRKENNEKAGQILVGGAETYEARCRLCYAKG